jgi:signal transduction histidine kinase
MSLTLWANLGIRAKLAILIEVAMIVIGAATGLVATVRHRTTLEDQLGRRGLAVASDLSALVVRPLLETDLATLRRFVVHTMTQDYVRQVSVLDADGRVIMHSDLGRVGEIATDGPSRRAVGAAVAGLDPSLLPGSGESTYDIHAPITVAGARLGTVLLAYSRASMEDEIAAGRRQMLVVGLLAVLAAGVLAYLLSSYISVPIMHIAGAMETAATDGGVRSTLPVQRTDEIGVLAASFNAMADDLSRHRRHLEELVSIRTAELVDANVSLEREVAERTRAHSELRESRGELRALATHLQSVREEERTQIAREIHDELGQALTALKMDVHWIGHRIEAQPALRERARTMSALIDTTVQTVRRISTELRPKLLDDLGLSAAIEWQAREFEQRSGIVCDVRSEPEDIMLDPQCSTAFFRIFQETLTNVARHARARHVDVALRMDSNGVILLVSDDGIGITPERASNPGALGIVGMRERAYSLGGTFDVSGDPGPGTSVRVSIPFVPRTEA